jgi:hypothetical protein
MSKKDKQIETDMSNGGEEMNIDMSNRETGQNRQE